MFLHRELRAITASRVLRQASVGLVNVYIPLIMLSRGAQIWQVCAFYLAYSAAKLAVNYPSMLLINRYGVQLGMQAAILFSMLHLASLTVYVSTGGDLPAYAGAVSLALTNSFLWNSEHLHVSRVLAPERKGRDIAVMTILQGAAALFAPLAGGLAMAAGGQVLTLCLAVALAMCAAWPARRLDRIGTGHQPVRVIKYSLWHAPLRDSVANFSFNVNATTFSTVWPVYLALTIGSFATLGWVVFAAELISLALMFVAGRRGDGKGRRVLLEGSVATGFLNCLRILATTPMALAGLGGALQAAASYQQTSWTSIYYGHARRNGPNYIMSLEIAGDLANIAVWGALLASFRLFDGTTQQFTAVFVTAGIASLGCLLISKEPATAPPSPAELRTVGNT
ncbi:hypothetical protein RCO28_31510 [Streptomyces sp. LHD-70]|uniref:hypothetical protein n=1 Tax=Streptomyces sp. LHD-70 TaxID=3072140 RepID=UPI00280F9A8F|nr:hypothetical protein [Streptomyces sp. LHD-70]MDQ8706966.1 hypothetical protein [Streptomyces sp. LHD-70]